MKKTINKKKGGTMQKTITKYELRFNRLMKDIERELRNE
jgi:hypothetical protein